MKQAIRIFSLPVLNFDTRYMTSHTSETIKSNKMKQAFTQGSDSEVSNHHTNPYYGLPYRVRNLQSLQTRVGIIKLKSRERRNFKLSAVRRDGRIFLRITPPNPRYRATFTRDDGIPRMHVEHIEAVVS